MSRKRNKNRNASSRFGNLKDVFRCVRQDVTLKSSKSPFVMINSEEMNYLSRYILDFTNIETGGQLFGYWTADNNPVILFVLGPGDNAGHYSTFFKQDIEYLRSRAALLHKVYGLEHIGEWHSHHQLGLAYPSGHDASNISKNIRRLGYSRFLLCIGTCTESESSINAFLFENSKNEYNQIPWLIKNTSSPYRHVIDSDFTGLFIKPETGKANMQNIFQKENREKISKIIYNQSYWLNIHGNSKILVEIIEFLKKTWSDGNCIPTLDNNNEIHLIIYKESDIVEDIHFPMGFPDKSPVRTLYQNNGYHSCKKWKFNGNIVDSFISFYSI